jgi:hypothetical protein
MTDAGHKVLTGFVRLSSSDRREVTDAMNQFLAGTSAEQSRLRTEYEKAVMGPEGSSCPCCDRSETPD